MINTLFLKLDRAEQTKVWNNMKGSRIETKRESKHEEPNFPEVYINVQ